MTYMNHYMTTGQAAAYLAVSRSWLEKLRLTGSGPAYSKPSLRRVLYAKSDLDAWVGRFRRLSTSEVDGKEEVKS